MLCRGMLCTRMLLTNVLLECALDHHPDVHSGSKPAVVDDDPAPTPAAAPATPEPTPPPPAVVEDLSVKPLQVLDKQDIAEVLGQFPSREATPAEWAEPTVIDRLLKNHQLAFETWKRAAMNGALDNTPRPSMEYTTTTAADQPMPTARVEDFTVRAGKVTIPAHGPPTQLPPAFSSHVAAEDITVRAGIAYPAPDPSSFDSLPRELAIRPKTPSLEAKDSATTSDGGDSRRHVRFSMGPEAIKTLDERNGTSSANGASTDLQSNASVRFGRNVASSSEEYNRKFGRYHDLPRYGKSTRGGDTHVHYVTCVYCRTGL